MAIIYALYYPIVDKVYIGQTINDNSRYRQHCNDLKQSSHHNYLLQYYYNYLQELPIFTVLEICKATELNIKEIAWINEFDSFNTGMNLTIGGTSVYGEKHPQALNTLEEYLEVLYYLSETNLLYREISSIVGITEASIRNIASGNKHRYLKDIEPNQYNKMMKKLGTRTTSSSRGITYPKIINPNGEIFTVDSLSTFANRHELHVGHLNEVLKKHRCSHKGWRLYEAK